jgi:hypothetical protein
MQGGREDDSRLRKMRVSKRRYPAKPEEKEFHLAQSQMEGHRPRSPKMDKVYLC